MARGDDTLKRGGRAQARLVVETTRTMYPSVSEPAAIGVLDDVKGEEIACFLIRVGYEASDPLRNEMRAATVAPLGNALDLRSANTSGAKGMPPIISVKALDQDLVDTLSLDHPQVGGVTPGV